MLPLQLQAPTPHAANINTELHYRLACPGASKGRPFMNSGFDMQSAKTFPTLEFA